MPTERTFESGNAGPRLLVFGALHGNETCGPAAIERIIASIGSGKLYLKSGSVTFVPTANPRAFSEKSRCIDEDLNRVLRHTDTPASYEAEVANTLCGLIDECDVLLDIHSTSAAGPSSIFVDYPDDRSLSLARAIGAEYLILDWPRVYESNVHGFVSYDSERYAHEHGKIGITVECGQHAEPEAIDVAERSILNAMRHLGLIEGRAKTVAATYIQMRTVEKKREDGDVFARVWTHLQMIPEGTLIATRASGDEIRADRPSVIVLPKHSAKAGEEWFYLASVKENTPVE